MALPPFIKRRDSPADKAFVAGDRPADKSQLGPFPSAVTDPRDFKNEFIGQRFNPGKKEFWQQVFSQETADASQEKLNLAYQTNEPNFPEPMNQLARDFLAKYSGPGGAIDRGLVPLERAVLSQSLAVFAQEPAGSSINTYSPETAGTSQFPGTRSVRSM